MHAYIKGNKKTLVLLKIFYIYLKVFYYVKKVFCILCNFNTFALLLKKTFVCFVEVAPGGSEPGLYPSVSDNSPAPIGFESHGECIQYTSYFIFSQNIAGSCIFIFREKNVSCVLKCSQNN